ncbi:MAG: DUF6770 family protein [Bacteroidia bacterium]
MQKIKQLVWLILFVSVSVPAMAQTRDFTNLISYRRSGSGPILENDNLKGYYAFYMYDKADKKNDAYQLQLMDDNLNLVKSIDVLRPRGDYLMETVFNGTCFVSMFYNKKNGLDLTSYDKTGKTLGTHQVPDLPKMEERRIAMALTYSSDDVANSSIFTLGNKGFVRQSFAKNEKIGYSLEAYDNNMKVTWTFGSDPQSELLEMCDVIYSSENYIVISVTRKKSLMTRNMDSFIIMLDAKTGKSVFEKAMKDNNEWSVLNVFIDEEKSTLYYFGEYYPVGEEVMKSKSEGVVMMTLDVTGKEILKKKYSWVKDLNTILKTDLNEAVDTKGNIRPYFHRIYKAQNGHIIAVGEQYGKAASAMGIASRAMGGGGSVVQMNILNMVVLDINSSDLSINSYNAYLKKKTSVQFPSGYEMASATQLAMYMKLTGGFDYEFSTYDIAKDKFACVYRDYDRKKDDGEKADLMLGVIKYEGGKLAGARMPIMVNSNRFSLSPAKPGFVAVTEYYRKKKTLTFRLEKLIY